MQVEQKELVRMFSLKLIIIKKDCTDLGSCSAWFGVFSVLWFFSSDLCKNRPFVNKIIKQKLMKNNRF